MPIAPPELAPVVDGARLEALRGLDLLDTPPEPAFERLVRLAVRILDAPVALVSLVDADRQFFKASRGLPEPWCSARETPLSHSFCQHVVATRRPLLIDDARTHPLVRENLAIRDLRVVAYMGCPVTTSDGHVLGSFCVIDSRPRAWTEDQAEILSDLTESVITEIELRRDIALRHRVEDDLRAARRAADAANRAKGDFLASMSHEVRTPMAAVVGFADMLRDPDLRPAARDEAVESIRRNGAHILELLNDVLDLSRIEAGELSIEQVPSDPAELLREVVDSLRGRVKDGVTLHVDDAKGPRSLAALDPTRVRQVLYNLGGNAAKFTTAGTIHFRLSAEPHPEPRHAWLRFEVEDTGIGIAAETFDDLFEPFRQAAADTTRKYGGSGLGLSISRRLAQSMGGDITLTSCLGAGSCFVLRLPARLLARTPSTAPPPDPPAPPPPLRFSGRVLIAEDSPDIRRVLTYQFRGTGARIEFAEDGHQAVAQALASPFDLILMDMQMPGLDGFAATRAIRSSGFPGPIVALTAHAHPDYQARCADAGCDELLSKPIRADGLHRLLARYLAPA